MDKIKKVVGSIFKKMMENWLITNIHDYSNQMSQLILHTRRLTKYLELLFVNN